MTISHAVVVSALVLSALANAGGNRLALDAGKTDLQKIENLYLLHYSAKLLTSISQYATIASKPIYLQTDVLETERCQFMLPLVRDWQAKQTNGVIDRQLHFQQLLTISQLLIQLQHRLQELREKQHKLEINLMREVTAGQDFDQEKQELERKIKTITSKINTIFTNDRTNMILTLKVKDNITGKKIAFYQKLALDYYRTLETGAVGKELITRIMQTNNTPYVELLHTHIQQSVEHLQEAWQHTCGKSRTKPRGFAMLLYYFKHKLLVEQVEQALQTQKLLTYHDKLKNRYKRQNLPSHYHSSATSFFGMLGALVLPSLFVPRQHNRITLPLMALAGSAFTWQKVGALVRVRQQLRIGAFNELNTYDDYRTFADNTSVSKYTFSHIAAVALAIVLRKMPTPRVSGILNVDTKVLVKVNVVGSFASLIAIEATQSKSLNFLKDREFFYNVFAMIMLDSALAYLSSVNLPDSTRVSAIAAVTLMTSIVAHIASGKEINWDRIIYDTTFVSTYSIYKATYFYTRGSRALINKLNVQGIAQQTGIMSAMAVISNAMGNIPYSLISRQWIEKKTYYNKDIAELANKLQKLKEK